MTGPAIRYFEVHPVVASADCETRMQIPARISPGTHLREATSIGTSGKRMRDKDKEELHEIKRNKEE